MRSLIILRGLPGAGKSTLAGVLAGGSAPVFSIDTFFTDPVTGEYNFQFDKNHLAYRHCQELTEEAMKEKKEKIFVDNAFTLEWEMEPYFLLAAKYNYRVFVCTVEKRHKGGNVHGVSDAQLQKMAEKYKVVLL